MLLFVGIIVYFAGLFGAPRMLVFIGAAIIVASLIAYFLEEFVVGRARNA